MARRRASSPLFVTNDRYFRSIEGLAEIQAKIASLPEAIRGPTAAALNTGGKALVKKIQSIAPVSELTDTPGELRNSVHIEPGDHELAIVIVEDGRSDDGKVVAAHVEYGHKARDGSHVQAVPHFWVSYQVMKKSIKSRLARAMTAGAKAAFNR